MKIKIILTALILLPILTYAQYDRQFTQYLYNGNAINPAYAGVKESMSIFGQHRIQWVGITDAPTSSTISVMNKFENSRVGIGGGIINENIGNFSSNIVSADFAYVIPTSERFKLSFGLKAVGEFVSMDYGLLNPSNSSDSKLANNLSAFNPNFGAGLYFFSDRTQIGFSIPYMLKTNDFTQSAISMGAQNDNVKYYLTANHLFDLSSEVQFKPSLLLRYANQPDVPFQVDITANFLLYNRVVAQASYRVGNAARAMVGFYVNKSFMLGYGYDISTATESNGYNQGSHDFMLRYEMFNRGNKAGSPRFF